MVGVLGGEEAFIGALEGNFGQPDNRDERENVPRERKVQMHREAVSKNKLHVHHKIFLGPLFPSHLSLLYLKKKKKC